MVAIRDLESLQSSFKHLLKIVSEYLYELLVDEDAKLHFFAFRKIVDPDRIFDAAEAERSSVQVKHPSHNVS